MGRMTDNEILHLFTIEKAPDMGDKQVQLQELQDYKSPLRISEIRDIISIDDSK